jgi:hypothetical protein
MQSEARSGKVTYAGAASIPLSTPFPLHSLYPRKVSQILKRGRPWMVMRAIMGWMVVVPGLPIIPLRAKGLKRCMQAAASCMKSCNRWYRFSG